jgi:hypothetical protein
LVTQDAGLVAQLAGDGLAARDGEEGWLEHDHLPYYRYRLGISKGLGLRWLTATTEQKHDREQKSITHSGLYHAPTKVKQKTLSRNIVTHLVYN